MQTQTDLATPELVSGKRLAPGMRPVSAPIVGSLRVGTRQWPQKSTLLGVELRELPTTWGCPTCPQET